MVHIGTTVLVESSQAATPFGRRIIPAPHAVLVVRDDDKNNELLDTICEFLDIGVEHASSADDLATLLRGLRPMAVIADLDSEAQDGFHVMKVVASYDRTLPIMLLTSNDPSLLGAVDAVQAVWGLTRVATVNGTAGIGTLVDFMCRAARDAGRDRLIRVQGAIA
jgi:CheY-like chemotaxis protein